MNASLFKSLWTAFNEDKVMRLASSVAFTAMFSLAPLLVILIAVVGWILGVQNGGHGHRLAENALLDPVSRGAGKDAAAGIRALVAVSFNRPRQSLVAQAVGWGAFVLGAMALFSSLQDAINAIWHVEAARGGWKQLVRDRLASFAMILGVGFLLLLTFVANAGIAFLGAHVLANVPFAGGAGLVLAGQAATLLLGTLIFAFVYKVLPDVDIAWRDVWIGAAVTALLFVFGEALIAWYLAVAGVASAYGAAGSLLVGLLWIYYSAIIVLVGAEYTKVAAGRAKTTVPSLVRRLSEEPAGIDPRAAAGVQRQEIA